MTFVLAELQLTNFKGFSRHSIPLRDVSVLVGRNNAGKSTLIEALRLVAIVADRYTALAYHEPPAWTNLPLVNRGVSPSLRGLEFDFRTAFHGLGEGPAAITAKFVSRQTITVHVGPEEIHAVIKDRKGTPISSKGHALRVRLPRVSIQPQVGPLVRNETILDADYVRGAMSSHLASSHFRNQLRLFPKAYKEWAQRVEDAWPGIRIIELDDDRGFPGDPISLLVRDGNFAGEVGWMGHGLQMWLQMMWYLTLAKNDTTVILDEPDVYMHPDLQRGLLRMIRRQHPQVIVATHSVEIMSEARPAEIVMVDRARRRSRFATSVQAVQSIIDHLGGVQPLQLTRLWNAQRCVFVEGGDFRLLKFIHDRLDPASRHSLEEIPNMSIGGWGGWHHAIGASMLLQNEAGKRIKVYCLLDRDYHPASEVAARMKEAAERDIELRIWGRKEIENYLLIPTAISRVLASRVQSGVDPPNAQAVTNRIERICDELKDALVDQIANELFSTERKGLPAANRKARELVADAWKTEEGRQSLISGKEVLLRLGSWARQAFGCALGPDDIAAEVEPDEVPVELARVIHAISTGGSF